jgi:hypothetical protein
MVTLPDGSNFGQLRDEIFKCLHVPQTRQIIKAGYPLAPVNGNDYDDLKAVSLCSMNLPFGFDLTCYFFACVI